MKWGFILALSVGLLPTRMALGGDDKDSCLPALTALSPLARTAELANIANGEAREIAQVHLGREGFLNSAAYVWGVAELYYENPRMGKGTLWLPSSKAHVDASTFPGVENLRVRPIRRIYDDAIVKNPRAAARAILAKLMETFDGRFLHEATDPKSADEAVAQLGDIMTRTGLSQKDVMLAFEQMKRLRENPEMKERMLLLMEKTLADQAPILLRQWHAKDLAKRIYALPMSGENWGITGMVGAFGGAIGGALSVLAHVDPLVAALTVGGVAGSLPIGGQALVLATRMAMARFSAAARSLLARKNYAPKEVVDLKLLAGVTEMPAPMAPLALSLSSPSLRRDRYEPRKAAIEATNIEIPATGFNARSYGLAVQNESASIATAVLRLQKYAASKEIWAEVEGHLDGMEKALKSGKVTRGEAVNRLTQPLLRRFQDFETFFQEIDQLREDNLALQNLNARAVALAKEEKSRRLAVVDSLPSGDPATAKAEREILALDDRIKSLTHNQLTLKALKSVTSSKVKLQ